MEQSGGIVLRLASRGLLLERTQQPVEALLILVMVFPMLEVADVSCALNVLCPRGGARQDSPIQAHGKQDIWHALWFLIQGPFNFIGHPRTGDGVLRQDQQQLVVDANRLIDADADFITHIQVFWGIPAAYSLV